MTSADLPDETASFAFWTFFGNSKEGAVVLDLNGEVLDVNAAVLHLIKLDRAQVIGQRFDRLIDVDLGDSLPQILQSFAQASQPGPLDLSLPFAGQELAAQLRVIEYANAGALLLTIHAPLSVADVSLSAEGALGQLSILSPESDVRGGRIPLDLGVSECPLSLNGWPARLDLNGRQSLSAAPRRSLVRSYSGDRQAWLALIEEDDRERIRKATSQLLAGEVTTVQETYRVVCNTPPETFYVQETLTAVRQSDGSLDHWAGTLLDVTPLYRSRDRLLRYQHFAERILDAVPFLVFLFDFQNARVPFASHQSTELLGISPVEMRSRSQEFILRHLHPDVIADLPRRRDLHSQLQDGEVFLSEWQIKDAQDQWRWMAGRTTVLERTQDGAAKLVFGCVYDTTAVNQAAETRRKLTAIVESSGDAITSCTLDGTFLTWNKAAERIFGYTDNEIIGQPLSLLIPESQRGDLPEFWDRLSCGEIVADVETIRRRKDGTLVPVSLTLSPIRDKHDKITAVSAVVRDISERKQSEQKLNATTHRLQAVLEGFPDRCFSVEPDGTAVELTAASASNELIPTTFAQLFPQDLLERVQQEFERAKVQSTPRRVEYSTKGGSATERFYEARFVRIPEGTILLVIRDISELKRAELRAENNERLLRRLFDLQERERKLLSYEIHDGFVQYVVGAAMILDAVQHEIESGSADCDDVGNLLQDGRSMLRDAIGEGRTLVSRLRPMIIDERGIVDAINYLVQEEQARSDCEIRFHHELQHDRLAPLLEASLFRIVRESIINALRHGEASRIEVTLTQSSNDIHLVVTDNGKGFDPATVSEDRFGLEGIRERARLFGGKARIESHIGQGTSIAVTLPLNHERHESAAIQL